MWKEIQGYEGYYEINDSGEIRNTKTKLILSPGVRSGYKFVVLCKDGVHQKHNVHRLVALHFVPNPNNYPMVMHKDNDKLNVEASNLDWGTAQQNTIQAHLDGLCVDRRKTYNIYNGTDDISCVGCDEVLSLIQSKSKSRSVVTTMIKNNQTIHRGPYTGYKIRRLEKPFKIDVQRSAPCGSGESLNVEPQANGGRKI